MKWLILVLGILANASVSVLVKIAMMPPRKFSSFASPMEALTNLSFWLGLGLYGTAFFLYAAAITKLPLNVAHPVLTTGAVVTNRSTFSILFFREPFRWMTVAGIILVIVGVALITAHTA